MIPLTVANEIAAHIRTIPALSGRTDVGPTDQVNTPNAKIVLPELINFDQTYGRGSDRMTWPVLVLICKVDDRSLMSKVSEFCTGSGPKSIKTAIEGGTAYTSCDSVRVTSVRLDVVTWQGIDFQGALFELDIFGSGT